MRVILLVLLSLFMTKAAAIHAQEAPASAQDTWSIGMHLVSWHSNPAGCYPLKECNDINPGVSVTWDGWLGGVYRNSLDKVTVYAGRSYALATVGPVTALVGVALATGYRVLPVVPVITPALSVRLATHWRAQVLWLPRMGRVNDTNVLHLMIVRLF